MPFRKLLELIYCPVRIYGCIASLMFGYSIFVVVPSNFSELCDSSAITTSDGHKHRVELLHTEAVFMYTLFPLS